MTEDNDILTESAKTVECFICERLIIVPENFNATKGTHAEIIIDQFDMISQIKIIPKTKKVICQVCAAEVIILQLQQFLEKA